MTLYNVIMFLVVAASIVAAVLIYFKPDPLAGELDSEEDHFSLEYLTQHTKEQVNDFLKLNVAELDMNKTQSDRIEANKKMLRKAMNTCYVGDSNSKGYVKEYIKQVLTGILGISEETIDLAIHFSEPDELSMNMKFKILLYLYRKEFDIEGFKKLLSTNHLGEAKGEDSDLHYQITYEEMTKVYHRHKALIDNLTFQDKLDILTQYVYEKYLGLDIVDEIRDLDVDGVMCGVSGIPYRENQNLDEFYCEECGELPMVSYNSIWVTVSGKPIDMAFLGFGSERSFERVCKRIYKFDSPGTLSASRGYIVNDMADGSRIVVVRPPMAESWGFFCRKLNVGAKESLETLEPYCGKEKLIELVKWIIGGSANVIITGAQGTGKSTFMMSAIDYIRKTFTLRVQEMAFELNLRIKYPTRNIMSLRQTETVSGQDGLNVQKKMDGSCNLLGEVADAETTRWAIQICQTGSNQLIATHHANSTPDLIKAFSDNSNDPDKLSLAATSLNFDIHLGRNDQGERYVERITAICPHVAEEYSSDLDEARKQYFFRQTDRQVYDCIDIMRWEDREFKFVGCIDDRNREKIAAALTVNERKQFYDFCDRMKKEVGA